MSAGTAGLVAYAVLITAWSIFLMGLLDEAKKQVTRLAKLLHPSQRPTLSILQRQPVQRIPPQRGGAS